MGQSKQGGLVGACNFVSALLDYHGFENLGIQIVAAFDSDPMKVDTSITL